MFLYQTELCKILFSRKILNFRQLKCLKEKNKICRERERDRESEKERKKERERGREWEKKMNEKYNIERKILRLKFNSKSKIKQRNLLKMHIWI